MLIKTGLKTPNEKLHTKVSKNFTLTYDEHQREPRLQCEFLMQR